MNGSKLVSTKAIIFDCDGTIIDTLKDIAAAMNRALEQYKLPQIEYEQFKVLLGDGVNKLVERALGEENKEYFSKVLETYNAEYRRLPVIKSLPYAGIKELLDFAKKNDILTFVLTNKDQDLADTVVNKLFAAESFTEIVGTSPSIKPKPDQTGINYLFKKYKLKTEEVMYLGDTNTDMKTAVDAHLKNIYGVSWGFRPKEELVEAGAKFIIDTPLEIITFLEEVYRVKERKKTTIIDMTLYAFTSLAFTIFTVVYLVLEKGAIGYYVAPLAFLCLEVVGMVPVVIKLTRHKKLTLLDGGLFSCLSSGTILASFVTMTLFVVMTRGIFIPFWILLALSIASVVFLCLNIFILIIGVLRKKK